MLGADGKETAAAVVLKYGAFLQTIVDFLIIAFAIFLVIKAMNTLQEEGRSRACRARRGRGAADRDPRFAEDELSPHIHTTTPA